MKKITTACLLSATVMMVSHSVLAESTTPVPPPTPSGTYASLESYLFGLYEYGKHWVEKQNLATPADAAAVATLNTATTTVPKISDPQQTITVTPMQAAEHAARKSTEDNLTNSLAQPFYSMYQNDKTIVGTNTSPGKLTTADGKSFVQYMNQNSLAAMSIGPNTQAGDTLFIDKNAQNSPSDGWSTVQENMAELGQPTQTHNNYLDFSTLFTPTAYTPAEQTAAKEYLKYAAQSTKDLTQGINFSSVYANPAALLKLKNNPDYQNYVLTMRSILAQRSISMTIMNQLIAERTPITNLGQTAGLPKQYDKEYPAASPLQVEAYQATNRVNNPTWYAGVQQESPAAVQRDTLFILAEIEQQNYQAHLDRERILAALSAANLESSTNTANVSLMAAAAKVNAAIQNATNASKPPKSK